MHRFDDGPRAGVLLTIVVTAALLGACYVVTDRHITQRLAQQTTADGPRDAAGQTEIAALRQLVFRELDRSNAQIRLLKSELAQLQAAPAIVPRRPDPARVTPVFPQEFGR
jgi:ABC-type uncharacterized transport system auxiliary subunit